MIDHAVDIDDLRNLHLPLHHDCLLVHCIDCEQYPLPSAPEEGRVSINVPEIANRGYNHTPQCVFLQPHSRDIHSEMRSEEDACMI